jgi:hypothetical protein
MSEQAFSAMLLREEDRKTKARNAGKNAGKSRGRVLVDVN